MRTLLVALVLVSTTLIISCSKKDGLDSDYGTLVAGEYNVTDSCWYRDSDTSYRSYFNEYSITIQRKGENKVWITFPGCAQEALATPNALSAIDYHCTNNFQYAAFDGDRTLTYDVLYVNQDSLYIKGKAVRK